MPEPTAPSPEIDAEEIVAAHAGLAGTPAVTMQTLAPSMAS
jgi:hypothetical protein